MFKKNLNIKVIRELKKGLSFARNRLLKEIRKTNYKFVAFFDDDCEVDKNWLIEMFKIASITNADIIGGPQLSKSKSIYSKLLERKEKHESNITWVSTNNVLMKYKIFKQKINFSNKLNLIGGEDQLFFKILNQKGFKIIWNKNAIVREERNKYRENLNWFLKRNFRYGASSSIIYKETYDIIPGFFISLLKSFLDFSKSILCLFFLVINFKKFLILFLMYFSRFLGVYFGLVGFQIREYAK